MSSSTAPCEDPASSTADDAPDPAVLRAERRLRLLEELADIGMDLARSLRPSAATGPGEAPLAEAVRSKGREPADAFGPLSRAIRLTLALEATTDAELRDLKAGIVRARAKERKKGAKRLRLAAAKELEDRIDRVRGLVIDVAVDQIDDDDKDAFSEIVDELDERLSEHEAEFGRLDRPLRETVEGLCKVFGLSPDWSRWTGEGWSVDVEGKLFEPVVLASRQSGAGLAEAAVPPPPPEPPTPPSPIAGAPAPATIPPRPGPAIPLPPWRLELARDLE
jgi:hypothetical protein